MGNRFAQDDLYFFRLRENNARADLRYVLQNPRLETNVWYFRNLVAEGELFPFEMISNYGIRSEWRNQRDTFNTGAMIAMGELQFFHPSDAAAFVDSALTYRVFGGYRPANGLWWTQLDASYTEVHDQPIGEVALSRYTETEDRWTLTGKIGARVGPKYQLQVDGAYNSVYETMDKLGLQIQRDLHDAWVLARINFAQDTYNTSYQTGEKRDALSFTDTMDFQIAISPKLPNQQGGVPGIPSISILTQSADAPSGGEASGSTGLSLP
jgi:hypothetical protein